MPERTESIPQKGSGNFGTVADILKFMQEKKIPLDAEIEYMGCGSHSIEFVWQEDLTISFDAETVQAVKQFMPNL